MMKVKPFSYHIPPRRKAYPSTTSTRISTTCSSSSSSSPSTSAPTRTHLFNHSYSSRGDDSRRTSNRNCSNNVKSSNSRKDSSSTTPPYSYLASLSSLCLCGIGGITVLTLVLLIGFIGVAGQGKFPEMDGSGGGSGRLPLQSHLSYPSLSHRSFTSLSNLADGFDNESDEALQQRISSMGHYGIKYRNDSYNYSSHITPSYYYPSRQQKYKVDPGMGKLRSTSPHESLFLSLHEDDEVNDHAEEDDADDQRPPSQNNSGNGDEDENKISQQSQSIQQKLTNRQRQRLEDGDAKVTNDNYSPNKFSSFSKWRVPTQTKFNAYNNLNAKSTRDKSILASLPLKQQYEIDDFDDDNKSEINVQDQDEKSKHRGKSLFPSDDDSGRDADDEGENEDFDDDAHVLERFTPGNSSHTSGKLRFRQGSQAEVDGVDLDEDSLFPPTKGSTSSSSSSSTRRRPRRSVVHLYDMVVCSTGCNPLIFKGYGCYCGFLGSGLTVDGIDKCCAKHDFCYHHAKCPPLLTYFVPYYWRCDHGRPQCVTDFRGWKGVCGAHLCECDRQFAECLKKFPCPRSRAMCVTSPWRFWQNLLMTPSMRYRY